nr:MAG TPA: hypothetical protein [Caudoviricetes sp.]
MNRIKRLRSSLQNSFCSLACVSGLLNRLPVLPIQRKKIEKQR